MRGRIWTKHVADRKSGEENILPFPDVVRRTNLQGGNRPAGNFDQCKIATGIDGDSLRFSYLRLFTVCGRNQDRERLPALAVQQRRQHVSVGCNQRAITNGKARCQELKRWRARALKCANRDDRRFDPLDRTECIGRRLADGSEHHAQHGGKSY